MLEKLRGLGGLRDGKLGRFADSLDTLSKNPDLYVSLIGLNNATDIERYAQVNFEGFVR